MNAHFTIRDTVFKSIDGNDVVIDRNHFRVIGIIEHFPLDVAVLSFDDAHVEGRRHLVRCFHVDSGGSVACWPLSIVLRDSCLGEPLPASHESKKGDAEKETLKKLAEIKELMEKNQSI